MRVRAEDGGDSDRESHVIDEFNVSGDGDSLLLPVKVNARRCVFVLDTGCTLVIFDDSLKGELGAPEGAFAVEALEEEKELSLYQSPRALSVGKFPLKTRLPVACANLTAVREALGIDVGGILGMDPLWRCIVRLDFDRGKLAFLRSVDHDAGERVDLHHGASGTPRIALKSALGTQYWAIDTGHVRPNSVSLSSVDFMVLTQNKKKLLLRPSLGMALSGGVVERNAMLGDVSLGSSRIPELIASEHAYFNGNLLSLAFWSRFNITFDFPRSAMYLKPNGSINRPDRVDLSGARFVRRRGKMIVDGLQDGSAAMHAGLRVNDVIESVRGEDGAAMRLFTLRRICTRPKEEIEMIIVRRGERHRISLKLPADGVQVPTEGS